MIKIKIRIRNNNNRIKINLKLTEIYLCTIKVKNNYRAKRVLILIGNKIEYKLKLYPKNLY